MIVRRSLLVLAASLAAFAAQAQAPAKIAITSLVGDTITLSAYRDRAGTHINQNHTHTWKAEDTVLDLAVLRTAEAAVSKAIPGATVAMLRPPGAGSSGDPTLAVVDGKVVATNPLVDGLRKQGFTHLVTATKIRAPNALRLADGVGVGKGQLEGLGFYVDPSLMTTRVDKGEQDIGLVAIHAYIQLTLVDLAANEVRATQRVLAHSTFTPGASKDGKLDPWEAMTMKEKGEGLDRLIRHHVAESVPKLFTAAK
jgi:hypothetical protein